MSDLSLELLKHETRASRRQEILKVTEELMEAINSGNYEVYTKLCDPKMTVFEPEALGNLIEGIDYHKFYFDHMSGTKSRIMNVKILNPTVRLLGEDGAYVAYVILTQHINEDGVMSTNQTEETRVWLRKGNAWKNVHLHRSTVLNELIA